MRCRAEVAAFAGLVLIGLVSIPLIGAQTQSADGGGTKPAFEVASIKPNKTGGRGMRLNIAPGGRFIAENISLKLLMEHAYGVRDFQISGAPAWFDSERTTLKPNLRIRATPPTGIR
jgi:hypothetical protein